MIDVVIITTGRRSLLHQTVNSLYVNAETKLNVTIVRDSGLEIPDVAFQTLVINASGRGASASRNIGAGTFPPYRRGSHVMFSDDDAYFCPGWDKALLALSERLPRSLVSGHGHPYNHAATQDGYGEPLLISTVNFFMPWSMWDDVGPFIEPGGPGGSEDYNWCMRGKAKGYGFAVTDPQCVIHCGLTSSSGKQIVGYNEMVSQNEALIQHYGLQGVIWK